MSFGFVNFSALYKNSLLQLVWIYLFSSEMNSIWSVGILFFGLDFFSISETLIPERNGNTNDRFDSGYKTGLPTATGSGENFKCP